MGKPLPWWLNFPGSVCCLSEALVNCFSCFLRQNPRETTEAVGSFFTPWVPGCSLEEPWAWGWGGREAGGGLRGWRSWWGWRSCGLCGFPSCWKFEATDLYRTLQKATHLVPSYAEVSRVVVGIDFGVFWLSRAFFLPDVSASLEDQQAQITSENIPVRKCSSLWRWPNTETGGGEPLSLKEFSVCSGAEQPELLSDMAWHWLNQMTSWLPWDDVGDGDQ